MEDAAHCSHKPSSLIIASRPDDGKHFFGFLIFSFFSVTCQWGVAFGCDCLIVKKEKEKKKTSS